MNYNIFYLFLVAAYVALVHWGCADCRALLVCFSARIQVILFDATAVLERGNRQLVLKMGNER